MTDPLGPEADIVGKLRPLKLDCFLKMETNYFNKSQSNTININLKKNSPSKLLQLSGPSDLVHILSGGHSLLQPSKVLTQRDTIANVTVSNAGRFRVVFQRLHGGDR